MRRTKHQFFLQIFKRNHVNHLYSYGIVTLLTQGEVG
jgi:hypothetical protein